MKKIFFVLLLLIKTLIASNFTFINMDQRYMNYTNKLANQHLNIRQLNTNRGTIDSFSFSCACSGVLSSAFSRFMTHILNDNLQPTYTNLTNLKSTLDKQLKKQQTQEKLLTENNKILIAKIVEIKKLVHSLTKQKEEQKR